MTKSKTALGAIPDVMSNPFAMSDAAERAQAFWSAQSAAAEHVQSFIDGWYSRRREAAAAAADCCAQLFANGGDASAAPRALTQWVSGSFERLRADAQEQATLATELASDMAGAFSLSGAKPSKRRHHAEAGKSEEVAVRARASSDVR